MEENSEELFQQLEAEKYSYQKYAAVSAVLFAFFASGQHYVIGNSFVITFLAYFNLVIAAISLLADYLTRVEIKERKNGTFE